MFVILQLYTAKRNLTLKWAIVSVQLVVLSTYYITCHILHSQMTKYEIMFYNALLVFGPTLLWSWFSGDMEKVNGTGFGPELYYLSQNTMNIITGI